MNGCYWCWWFYRQIRVINCLDPRPLMPYSHWIVLLTFPFLSLFVEMRKRAWANSLQQQGKEVGILKTWSSSPQLQKNHVFTGSSIDLLIHSYCFTTMTTLRWLLLSEKETVSRILKNFYTTRISHGKTIAEAMQFVSLNTAYKCKGQWLDL